MKQEDYLELYKKHGVSPLRGQYVITSKLTNRTLCGACAVGIRLIEAMGGFTSVKAWEKEARGPQNNNYVDFQTKLAEIEGLDAWFVSGLSNGFENLGDRPLSLTDEDRAAYYEGYAEGVAVRAYMFDMGYTL